MQIRVGYVACVLLLGAISVVMLFSLNGELHSLAKSHSVRDSSEHDFDFLVGSWTVQHRRLKHRLARSNEWETFSGTCRAWLVLAGKGNVDDNLLEAPTGTYRALTLRAFDPQTNSWSIWWLDNRHPHQLDVPVVGKFDDGVGTFIANDTFNGRPIVERFIWSDITPNSAKWQQAFSDDGGKTWETNWTMEFHRLASP